MDKSGPALKELVSDTSTKTGNILNGNVICTSIVPDDKDMIMVRDFLNIFSPLCYPNFYFIYLFT